MSEQKHCQSQRIGEGHETHGDALFPCCGRTISGPKGVCEDVVVDNLFQQLWRDRGDSRHDGCF